MMLEGNTSSFICPTQVNDCHTLPGTNRFSRGAYGVRCCVTQITNCVPCCRYPLKCDTYYNYVIMGPMASQITSLTIGYSTVCSDADQRKHQSEASLAFVWEIHRWPVNTQLMASNTKTVSIWWRHHEHPCLPAAHSHAAWNMMSTN